MKRLIYISYNFFVDVDYPIVRKLKKYNILWIIIIDFKAPKFFRIDTVENYCKINNIDYKIFYRTRKRRNLKNIIFAFNVITIYRIMILKSFMSNIF